jgi:hypothetical protein
MILVAEADFNKPLSEGKVIREIFAEKAREFIKEEFKRQYVYRI